MLSQSPVGFDVHWNFSMTRSYEKINRNKSQSPVGFDVHWNLMRSGLEEAEKKWSQSPVGFDVHWNEIHVMKFQKMNGISLNRLSALMFIGTVAQYTGARLPEGASLNRLSALMFIGTTKDIEKCDPVSVESQSPVGFDVHWNIMTIIGVVIFIEVSQSPVGFDVHWNSTQLHSVEIITKQSLNRLSALMFIGTLKHK